MAIHDDEDDEDDTGNNPLTMLFPDSEEEDGDEFKSPAVDDDEEAREPSQQLDEHFMSSIQSAVVTRQLRSEGLSFQLWPAATALVNLLDRHRSDPSTSPLNSTLAALTGGAVGCRRRLRILELGSGTGLVGISAAVALSADVTVTDLPHVLDNLRLNAQLNSGVLARHGGTVNVAALSWGETEDLEAIGDDYDLILGSDVVYHDHLYDPLLQTLRFFVQKKKVFVMGHLRRWKKESAFFNKAKKMFEVEVLHRGDTIGGSRHGVAVYRFTAKEKKLEGVGDGC